MDYILRLQRHGSQYRVTLPLNLIEACGFEDVELVRLSRYPGVGIMIKEYHGKRKKEGTVPGDKA